MLGVGAAREAHRRSDAWSNGLDAFLKTLRADEALAPAARSINQIAENAAGARAAFLEGVHRAGAEVYREPLTQSPLWSACVSEWGRGPGYKHRVADHLEGWFISSAQQKDTLEQVVNRLWEQSVISPLLRLAEETAPESDFSSANVVQFPSHRSG